MIGKEGEVMDNISIYFCDVCESHFGLFFDNSEIGRDDGNEAVCCCVCGNDDIEFVKDTSVTILE